MRRVFVPGDAVRGERVALTGEQAHYLLRVLRLGPGRRFSAVLPDGEERVAVIESAAGDEVHARLGEALSSEADPVVEVRLFPGLPKVAKLELIIQKCTEIGVASVQPVQCRRSVPQPRAEEVGRKLGRWERVAKEAARQSGRTSAPAILPPRPFPQAVADFAQTGGTGLVFSPHEAAGPASSARLLPPDSPEPIGVFVGPEGGFTEEEVAAGVALGFHAVSLGRRTLRAETAAIVACAILMYELGELR